MHYFILCIPQVLHVSPVLQMHYSQLARGFHFHSIQTQRTGVTPKMTSTGIEDQIYFVSLADHLGLIYIMRHKEWIYILYTI